MDETEKPIAPKDIVKAMGLVFGDIGTSPIYTLTVVFTVTSPTSEDIITGNPFLKLFALLKKITPPFVRFYDLPYNKLHGVITRLNI